MIEIIFDYYINLFIYRVVFKNIFIHYMLLFKPIFSDIYIYVF